MSLYDDLPDTENKETKNTVDASATANQWSAVADKVTPTKTRTYAKPKSSSAKVQLKIPSQLRPKGKALVPNVLAKNKPIKPKLNTKPNVIKPKKSNSLSSLVDSSYDDELEESENKNPTNDTQNILNSTNKMIEDAMKLASKTDIVTDEYDPLVPNDYSVVIEERTKEMQLRRLAEREEKRRKESIEAAKPIPQGADDLDLDSARLRRLKEREEQEKLQNQQNNNNNNYNDQDIDGEPLDLDGEPLDLDGEPFEPQKAFVVPKKSPKKQPQQSTAMKLMEKMGWQSGQGLGKNNQGIKASLVVKKTDRNSAVIVSEDSTHPLMSTKTIPANTSRVLLLTFAVNMVYPSEIDPDLRREIALECEQQYGEVKECIIHQIPGKRENEAVRVFLEFTKIDCAIRAYSGLNGRMFGGKPVQAKFYVESDFLSNQLEK